MPVASDADALTARLHHPCGRLLVRPEAGLPGAGWGRDRETSLRLADHELWFVWHGRGWMSTHRGRFELRPGFCCWMRPGGIYDAGLTGKHPLGFTYLHLADPGLPSGGGPPEFFQLSDVSYVDTLMRRIVQLVPPVSRSRWGEPADAPPAANALLRALLLELLDHAASDTPSRSPAERAIHAIAAEMRERPDLSPRLDVLARRAELSVSHFARLFKQAMGLSPQQYLLRLRLERACHLLVESNLSITQIADALGYHDVFFFSKQFKQHIAQTPSDYRRSAMQPAVSSSQTDSP